MTGTGQFAQSAKVGMIHPDFSTLRIMPCLFAENGQFWRTGQDVQGGCSDTV